MSGAGDLVGDPTIAPQFVANALLGPAFVGWTLHMWLFGVMLSGAWAYISTKQFSKDTIWTKIVLVLILALDIASAGIDVYRLLHYGVSQRRDPYSFTFKGLTDIIPLALISPVTVIVQGALTARVSMMFVDKRVWRAVFVVLSAGTMVVGLLSAIGATVIQLLSAVPSSSKTAGGTLNVSTLTAIWLWLCAAQNVTICYTLFVLLRQPHDGLSQAVRARFRRLSIQIIRAGAPTAIFALIGALLGSIFSHPSLRTVHIPFAFGGPLCSLYAIWLIACLDKRRMPPPTAEEKKEEEEEKIKKVKSDAPTFVVARLDKQAISSHKTSSDKKSRFAAFALRSPPSSSSSRTGGTPAQARKKVTSFMDAIVITTETSECVEVEEEEDAWQDSQRPTARLGTLRESSAADEKNAESSKLYNAVFK